MGVICQPARPNDIACTGPWLRTMTSTIFVVASSS